MWGWASETDAEVDAEEPPIGGTAGGDRMEDADARADEYQRPYEQLTAKIGDVGFDPPRVPPRTQYGRRNRPARAQPAAVGAVTDRDPAGAQSGFDEQRGVAGVFAAVCLPTRPGED